MIAGVVLGYIMSYQRFGYSRRVGGAVLVYLAVLGDIAMGQGQGGSTWDPVKTVCNMNLGRSVVLGNKMYVDGGEIMDQQNYLFGIDKPYYNSNMIRWQSECPILLFDCHITKPDTYIFRSTPLGTRPLKQVQCLGTPMDRPS